MLKWAACLWGGGKPDPANPKASKEYAEKQAKAKEQAKRGEILRRQQRLLKEEINQTWRIALGNEIPKKLKDTILITNITRRNVWMEDLFLFNQIISQFPDERFHPPSCYVLKWQPVGSYFQIIIPIDDPALQENAVVEMAKLSASQQKKMMFLFTTLDTTMPMFAPKAHPASLVSYRQKNEVLKKLSEYFLLGHITVEDMEQILLCPPEVWSNSLYNYLPADEQVFHTYLNERIIEEDPDKSIAKKYLDDEISLKEFEELKFPDRKKQRDLESLYYPLPFEGADCVICGDEKAGVVKCQTCDNMVCKRCIETVFQGGKAGKRQSLKSLGSAQSAGAGAGESKRQSFLLMHHRYCMRLGELPDVHMEVVTEPGYLRDFRKSSRAEVIRRFAPQAVDFDDDEYVAEYEAEEREKRRLKEEQERQRKLEAERLRALMNPPELQERRAALEERTKKFSKWKRDIDDVVAKVLDTSHTEQFIARNRRLKNEMVAKFLRTFQPSVLELQGQVSVMSVPGDLLPALRRDVDSLVRAMEDLLASVPDDEATGRTPTPSSRPTSVPNPDRSGLQSTDTRSASTSMREEIIDDLSREEPM